MNRNRHLLGLLLAGSLLLPMAHAEKADRNKPIEITANTGSLDQLKGVTTWSGNVVVIQGTLKLNADHVTVTQDKQGNQTMHATGRIVTFRQKMDGKNEWVEGQSSVLDYTSAIHLAVLTGNARVKRGEDLVIGNVITYNTETELYQVNGGPSSAPNKGRVTVILQPKNATPPSSAPAKSDGKPK